MTPEEIESFCRSAAGTGQEVAVTFKARRREDAVTNRVEVVAVERGVIIARFHTGLKYERVRLLVESIASVSHIERAPEPPLTLGVACGRSARRKAS